MIKDFNYQAAATIEQAAAQIGKTYLAGGTDLVPLLKYEVRPFEQIVDLTALTDLKYTKQDDDSLKIGALQSLTAIAEDAAIIQNWPALAFAAKCVASPQIRNLATIGGNIMQDRRCLYFNQSYEWRQSLPLCYKTGGSVCHQAPNSPECLAIYYGDVATALSAYHAQVKIHDSQGIHLIDIDRLLAIHAQNNGTTATSDLFIEEIIVPAAAYSKFIKQSVRDTIDFATFNAALVIDKQNKQMTITCGALNRQPFKLLKTMELINGGKHDLAAINEVALAEIKSLSKIIKEDTISPQVKRQSVRAILPLIELGLAELG